MQKRDQLLAQIYRLDYRMQEIKSVRTTIEQDSRLVFGGMLERLTSSEGHKTSVLQHEMAGIQQEIDSINEIIAEFTKLTNEGVTPLQFMVKCATMKQNIEYLLSKPFKTEIEVYPYDLPRELFGIRKELEETKQLENVLAMKDEIIFNLFQEMQKGVGDSLKELDLAATQEINSWAQLSDTIMSQLGDYQRVCFYCAEPLTEETVNTDCSVNAEKQVAAKRRIP